MRCYSCAKLSLSTLCKACQKNLFTPNIQTLQVGTLDVISFYRYDNIASLLHSKHKPEGYRIYKALAKMTLKPFIQEFIENDEGMVYVVGVDEVVKNGYAHVALLTHAMKSRKSQPLHATLLAKNRVSYSGKPLAFRLENPRAFHYSGKRDIDVILVDDIMTTGLTLQEAHQTLVKKGVNVLFALVLANVAS